MTSPNLTDALWRAWRTTIVAFDARPSEPALAAALAAFQRWDKAFNPGQHFLQYARRLTEQENKLQARLPLARPSSLRKSAA